MDENDIENGGYNQLQELIVKNSQNNNKQVSYIVNSKIKDVIHFFLLEQQGKIVIIKDLVGLDRDNFLRHF